MANMLKDKVVLVTGAGGGIGREMALLAAREGANVVCADLNEAGAKETASQINAQGSQALGKPCVVRHGEALSVGAQPGAAADPGQHSACAWVQVAPLAPRARLRRAAPARGVSSCATLSSAPGR